MSEDPEELKKETDEPEENAEAESVTDEDLEKVSGGWIGEQIDPDSIVFY